MGAKHRDEPPPGQKLAGHTFCLTGTAWTGRDHLEDMIRAEAGVPIRSMTSKSTILVDANADKVLSQVTDKVRTARRLGARIISSHSLKKILDGDVSLAVVLGDKKKKRKKVEPIDRERHRQLVKETLANIESIAFGK